MTKCLFEQLEKEAELLLNRVAAMYGTGLMPRVESSGLAVSLCPACIRAWKTIRDLVCVVIADGAQLGAESRDAELVLAVREAAVAVRGSSRQATQINVLASDPDLVVGIEQLAEMHVLVRDGAEMARQVLRVIEWQRRAGVEAVIEGARDGGEQGGEKGAVSTGSGVGEGAEGGAVS